MAWHTLSKAGERVWLRQTNVLMWAQLGGSMHLVLWWGQLSNRTSEPFERIFMGEDVFFCFASPRETKAIVVSRAVF